MSFSITNAKTCANKKPAGPEGVEPPARQVARGTASLSRTSLHSVPHFFKRSHRWSAAPRSSKCGLKVPRKGGRVAKGETTEVSVMRRTTGLLAGLMMLGVAPMSIAHEPGYGWVMAQGYKMYDGTSCCGPRDCGVVVKINGNLLTIQNAYGETRTILRTDSTTRFSSPNDKHMACGGRPAPEGDPGFARCEFLPDTQSASIPYSGP